MAFTHVLVPTDFSEPANQALGYAGPVPRVDRPVQALMISPHGFRHDA